MVDAPTSREVAMIVDSLRDLKESVTDLSRNVDAKMSVLVNQREFDRTRDDLTIDIGEVRAKIDNGLVRHDADIKSVRDMAAAEVRALKRELDAAEARRRSDRKWAVGTALTLAGLVLTAAGLLIAVFAQMH